MTFMENKSTEWEDDCMHFHGKVLTGKYSHWCPEFDYLPIDENCYEFDYCTCDKGDFKDNDCNT